MLSRLRWRRLARRRASAAAACRELGEALAAPLPDPGLPVRQAPMLAVDLEMTGLDPARDAILSIGWVPLDAGGVRLGGAGEVAIAGGGRSVGESATIHGIRDCDRDGGASEAEALAALVRAAAGRVTVFHHAPLDLGFLAVALHAAFGIGWLWPWIDTLDWERRRCPEAEERVDGSSRLDAVRERYGLEPRSAHNALADALSCAEVALVLAAHSRARLIDVCSLPGRA